MNINDLYYLNETGLGCIIQLTLIPLSWNIMTLNTLTSLLMYIVNFIKNIEKSIITKLKVNYIHSETSLLVYMENYLFFFFKPQICLGLYNMLLISVIIIGKLKSI